MHYLSILSIRKNTYQDLLLLRLEVAKYVATRNLNPPPCLSMNARAPFRDEQAPNDRLHALLDPSVMSLVGMDLAGPQ
jgi:hypothetical protein